MLRRRRAVRAGLAGAVVVAAAIVLSGPVLDELGFGPTRDAPSTVAGRALPPIAATPKARLAVAGDVGTGDAAEWATARRMASESRTRPYDGLLLLGDLVYEDGDPDMVDEAVTDPFARVLDSGTELLPVLGNHDYESGQEEEILRLLGRDRPWYVDWVGPVRVIVLDSNQVEDPEQTAWLRETLAQRQVRRTWTIAAMHHPAYSAGAHGSDMDVRQAWSPLFAEYDVPLVLAGHDHDYQRSTPQDGVTYVVSGGGAKLRPAGHEDFTAVSTSTLHYLDLLVYDDRLVGRAIDQAGNLVDTFTIMR